jgi:Nif-specific regulatory protein
MDAIISELIEQTESDQGVINLVSPKQEEDMATVVRIKDHTGDSIPFKVSDSIAGWVLKNKKLLCIADLDNDERFPGLDSHNGFYKSIICSPLMARGEIIGLTTLIRGDSKESFDKNNCHLVGILNSQTAQILANARLMEELAQSNKMLEISRKKLKAENRMLRKEVKSRFVFENIIGKSPAIKRALTMASKYSDIDSPVLIYGETGTGKELIARAIHDNSSRRSKPLMVFNCGVKTETLLESELFGHVRGSCTGAVRDRNGLFKEANGGAVFLDEIGEAPLSTQLALLRVIQNGEIKPLGSTKMEIVDVRVISATNRDY